jgi:hypothetical protein
MLNQVLNEIKNSKNGINLRELSRKLNIEQGALNGMIQFWVQKGRLVDDDAAEVDSCSIASGSCGSSCSCPDSCPFVMEMPKSYSLRENINL